MDLMSLALVVELMNARTDARTQAEQHCLVESVLREAVGEGEYGMRLVMEVKLQRMAYRYRNNGSACDLLSNPTQFSWMLTAEDERRPYTLREYEMAAQVVYTYLYNEPEPILPPKTLHYLNVKTATDHSWYDPDKVVVVYKNHTFLQNVK